LIYSTINHHDPITYLWTNVYTKLDKSPDKQEIHTVLANVTKHPLSGELNAQMFRESLSCMLDIQLHTDLVLDGESLGAESPFIGQIKGSAYNWLNGCKFDKPQFVSNNLAGTPIVYDAEAVRKVWNLPSQAVLKKATRERGNCPWQEKHV
jgi:hypothetical protein